MKKIILAIFPVLISITCYGQTEKLKVVQRLCSSKDSSVNIYYKQLDTILNRYITFNKNGVRDTIQLDYYNKSNSNTCQIDQIEINGSGLKEIHIIWSYSKPFGIGDYIGNETSWGSHQEFVNHEIWDLDNKEILFSALSYYYLEKYITHRGTSQKTKSFSKYDFAIKTNGQITITNHDKTSTLKPDNEEGVYRYIEGRYRKE